MINYSDLKKYFTDNGIKIMPCKQEELTIILGTTKFGQPIVITYVFDIPNVHDYILCKTYTKLDEVTPLDLQLIDVANKKFERESRPSKMSISNNILELDGFIDRRVTMDNLIKFSLSMMDVISNFK